MVALRLFWLALFVVEVTATCYWPNGNATTDDQDYLPCPGDGQCCKRGDSCLSNGLCFKATDALLYRGGCADKSWPVQTCPHICHDDDQLPHQWANLYRCNISDPPEYFIFTCGIKGGYETCGANLGHYNWSYPEINVDVAKLDPTSSSGDDTTSTTTSTPTSTSLGEGKCSSDNSVALGLGLGLGVPLLMAAGALAWLYLHSQRQIRSLQHALASSQMGQPVPLREAVMRELDNGGVKTSELESNDRQELAS